MSLAGDALAGEVEEEVYLPGIEVEVGYRPGGGGSSTAASCPAARQPPAWPPAWTRSSERARGVSPRRCGLRGGDGGGPSCSMQSRPTSSDCTSTRSRPRRCSSRKSNEVLVLTHATMARLPTTVAARRVASP